MFIKLDGKELSGQLVQKLEVEARAFEASNGKKVGLGVLLVGGDPASQVYVGHKEKMATKLGFYSLVQRLPEDCSSDDVRAAILGLNQNPDIHGFLVQLPLPNHLKDLDPLSLIDPLKDADGLTAENLGLMVHQKAHAEPCTPKGIMSLLRAHNFDFNGKEAVVVGRSAIVGWPMAQMLTQANATVTVCHSRTKDLKTHLKRADLVVVAAGKPEFLSAHDFKEEAWVVDVGVHRKDNKKLCGDVKWDENTESLLGAQSRVPGGVGPMTVVTLMANALGLAQKQSGFKNLN